jgi:antirestriction protein ArdC
MRIPSSPTSSTAAREELLERLAGQVLELRRSEAWLHYLAAQARFHRYSPRNVMLIAMQRPEASCVAGYRTWSSLGRQVRQGERAISILAPMLRQTEGEDSFLVAGFRWVSVFDISQTDGAALPSPVSLLDAEGPSGLVASLTEVAAAFGFAVEIGELPEGVNGECRWSSSSIVVERANPPLQQAKTLAHELGHALLHRSEPDRAKAEIEAEATAYVVLAALGADAAPYSAGYLASWLGPDADVSLAIRRSCEAIQHASERILAAMSQGAQDLASRAGISTPARP